MISTLTFKPIMCDWQYKILTHSAILMTLRCRSNLKRSKCSTSSRSPWQVDVIHPFPYLLAQLWRKWVHAHIFDKHPSQVFIASSEATAATATLFLSSSKHAEGWKQIVTGFWCVATKAHSSPTSDLTSQSLSVISRIIQPLKLYPVTLTSISFHFLSQFYCYINVITALHLVKCFETLHWDAKVK